jgi:enterochelin esterase-like enzyme
VRTAIIRLAWLPLLAGQLVWAQAGPPAAPPAAPGPAVEDFQPSVLNQSGRQYPAVNSEGRARFRITAAQAQGVRVSLGGRGGTALAKGEDGAWVGTTPPLDEGFHYYTVNIDGAEVPDPNTQYFYGSSRAGSGIEVPAKDRDFYAVKDVPHGQTRQVLYFSKNTNSVQRCFVYTPPEYDKNQSQRYGVLYLQHGGGEDETGWPVQGCTNLIMDNLIAAGKSKPFIIVMANSYLNGIYGGAGGGRGGARGAAPGGGPGAPGAVPGRGPGGPGAMGPVLDGDALFFAGAPAGPGGAAPAAAGPGAAPGGAPGARGRAGGGGRGISAGAFQPVLLDELIPYIDQNFRTLADQPHRAMAGLSMGGMFTKSITMANLNTFSHIGLFSGGSIAPTEITDMAGFKQKVKVVFVSYGSKENGAAGKTAVEALQQAGLKAVFYESPSTAHEWLTWRRSLYQFAPLLFQD